MEDQLAQLCTQGLMNDENEPVLEAWAVWLTQKDEEKRNAERLEHQKSWVEKLLDNAEGGCLRGCTAIEDSRGKKTIMGRTVAS